MHVLVYNENMRVTLTVPGTLTVYDLKEKVSEKTCQPGKSQSEWPADDCELIFNGAPLPDEMSLAECCIKDRDRIELARRAPEPSAGGGGHTAGTTALEPLLTVIDACAKQLDDYVAQIGQRQFVHQELFTRLLERLDGLSLDGLSDEERSFVRGQRKSLVKRCEEVSSNAARIPKL